MKWVIRPGPKLPPAPKQGAEPIKPLHNTAKTYGREVHGLGGRRRESLRVVHHPSAQIMWCNETDPVQRGGQRVQLLFSRGAQSFAEERSPVLPFFDACPGQSSEKWEESLKEEMDWNPIALLVISLLCVVSDRKNSQPLYWLFTGNCLLTQHNRHPTVAPETSSAEDTKYSVKHLHRGLQEALRADTVATPRQDRLCQCCKWLAIKQTSQ